MHRELYPDNWEIISKRIRDEVGKCEFCGAENYKPHPVTGSKVILTVAHLDNNPMNCERDNLKALCQSCHLKYDGHYHAINSAKTRYKKKLDNGQIELL